MQHTTSDAALNLSATKAIKLKMSRPKQLSNLDLECTSKTNKREELNQTSQNHPNALAHSVLWYPAHLGHHLASWVKHHTQDKNGKCHLRKDTDSLAQRTQKCPADLRNLPYSQ